MAHELIDGTLKNQYGALYDYAVEIIRSNPRSTVIIKEEEIENGPKFQRIYICFDALKKGFLLGCRPVIGLDGCFIKGKNSGQILSAVSIDANDQMYPIAYAVVESENRVTWEWFMGILAQDLNMSWETDMIFISDKQKGLLAVIGESFPYAEHRFCVQYLVSNFKRKFRGLSCRKFLWKAARATYMKKYDKAMEDMKRQDNNAVDWFHDKHPKHWSRAHFSRSIKCDLQCNNLCESFNAAIKSHREKTILTMLEGIRQDLMQMLHKREQEIKRKHGPVCPKIQNKLEKLKKKTGSCMPLKASEYKYEVRCWDGPFEVDLLAAHCGCEKWDLSGIPCVHAISAIYNRHEDPESYVAECFTINSHLKAYEFKINPMNGRGLWPQTNKTLLPPSSHVQPGRSRKNRKKDADEASKSQPKKMKIYQLSLKCRLCHKVGHNKRTCPQLPKIPLAEGLDIVENEHDIASGSKFISSEALDDIELDSQHISTNTYASDPVSKKIKVRRKEVASQASITSKPFIPIAENVHIRQPEVITVGDIVAQHSTAYIGSTSIPTASFSWKGRSCVTLSTLQATKECMANRDKKKKHDNHGS